MSTQKDSGKAGCRDRLFPVLRAFIRSWDELYGCAQRCPFCEDYWPSVNDVLPGNDGYGRPHMLDCPWFVVHKAADQVLEREYERKERQRTGLSAELLRSCERLQALAERQVVELGIRYGSDRNLGQIEADGELPPAISEARAVILKATV